MADAKIIISAQDKTKQAFDSVKANLGSINKAAAGIGLSISAAGLIAFGNETIKAAKEAEQASVRLSATLRATGNAAGITKKELDDFADSMAKSTQFDDESIRNAEAAFLKFGNIQEDVFKRGISLSADLASFLGTDVADAAQTVGKALSSPSEGVGALERQIGKLTKAQKDSIQGFADVGDLASAQSAVLDILQKKIGGTAQLMNTGWTKATGDLSKSWGELLETLGKTDSASSALGSLSTYLEDMKRVVDSGDWLDKLAFFSVGFTTPSMMKGAPKLSQESSGFIGGSAGDPAIAAAAERERQRTEAAQEAAQRKIEEARKRALAQVKSDVAAAANFVEALKKQAATLGAGAEGIKLYEAAHLKLTAAQKKSVAASIEQISAYEQFNEEQKQRDEELSQLVARFEALDSATLEAIKGEQSLSDALMEQAKSVHFLDAAQQELIESRIKMVRSGEATKALADEWQPLIEQANALRASVQPLEEFSKKWQEVLSLRDKFPGIIDSDTLAKLAKNLSDSYQPAENLSNAAKDLGLTFSSAFEDAIVGAKSFQEILQSLAQDISRIITRELVTEPLAKSVTGFVKKLDFKSLWPFEDGGVMTSKGALPLHKYASGGIANSAQLAIFGEGSRPEAFVPLPDGRSIPVTMEGGGGVVIHGPLMVVNTPDANSFRRSGPQVAADMQRLLNNHRRIS